MQQTPYNKMTTEASLNESTDIVNFLETTLGSMPKRAYLYYHIGFWVFICLISFTTLTLWYGQFHIGYIVHLVLQSIFGLLLSLSLQRVVFRVWNLGHLSRGLIVMAFILLGSFVWTVARMLAFVQLTDEQDIWWNLGGWYFGGIFIFSCWCAILHLLVYYHLLQAEHKILLKTQKKSQQDELKRIHAQKLARDAQLKMLRYQLNPHFLSNTLNAINSLIELEESQSAQKMVINLSRFLRYSIDTDPDFEVTLKKEIESLCLYMEIEAVRFDERLIFNLNMPPETEACMVPSMLLQPLVENSMKHVIAKSQHGGSIDIDIYRTQHELCFEVSDSGHDFCNNPIAIPGNENRGIGLTNVQQRLQAMYPDQHTFDCRVSSEGGLTTLITIPYKTQSN